MGLVMMVADWRGRPVVMRGWDSATGGEHELQVRQQNLLQKEAGFERQQSKASL